MNCYEIFELENSVDFSDKAPSVNVLLKESERMALLIALKKDQLLPEHISDVNAFIYVLDGKVKFILTDGEQFELSKGECMQFEPNEKHSVLALKDSKFLVVRI